MVSIKKLPEDRKTAENLIVGLLCFLLLAADIRWFFSPAASFWIRACFLASATVFLACLALLAFRKRAPCWLFVPAAALMLVASLCKA